MPEATQSGYKDQQTEAKKIKKMLNRYAAKPLAGDPKSAGKASKQADQHAVDEYERRAEQERLRVKKERR